MNYDNIKTFKIQSIKTKLNITIVSTVLIMFLVLVIPFFIFYEKYYISQQKDFLLNAYSKINFNVENMDLLKKQLFLVESYESVNILILNDNQEIQYSTSKIISNNNYKDIYNYPKILNFQNIKNQKSYIVFETFNNISNVENLHLMYNFNMNDNDYYVILEKTMVNVESIINGVVCFLFVFLIPMGCIASYIITKVSNFIISPILYLTKKSNEIAHFNFDTPINIYTNDEIGVLANNIQILSDELKNKINELEHQNYLLVDNIKEKDKNAKIQKEFISNVSHELKTPITLIVGYSEALKLNVDEQIKLEYMNIIISESHKMNNLISDMLDIARLQSGDKKIIAENFDFSQLIYKIIGKHKITFEKNNINLNYNILENCIVSGDMSKLELVLSNFIVNAVRYINDDKIININFYDENDFYIFKIFNTASNLSEEELKKIWGSFYKVDKAHSREKGGTGIGLYLVKTILELHSFEYGVNNKENGIEFFIKIKKLG